jgi:hypothetical protein
VFGHKAAYGKRFRLTFQESNKVLANPFPCVSNRLVCERCAFLGQV